MSGFAARLDQDVDVFRDDKGRIVLLPHDHRDPVRLTAEDEFLVDCLREGRLDLEGRGRELVLTDTQRRRFVGIVTRLDQMGLLHGRRRPPQQRMIRSAVLTSTFDAIAGMLARPISVVLSVRARGMVLTMCAVAICAALVTLWVSTGGRMFSSALTQYWWVAILAFFVGFPLLHEFSHAFVARLFGLQVTMVGAVHRGGLSWSPFVEARNAILSSDAVIRIWLPLIGVVCNLFLALAFGLATIASPEGSMARGVFSVLTLLMHVRVIVDGGFAMRSDATQALRIASDLVSPGTHRLLVWLVRGGQISFVLATTVMLALSLKFDGSGV